MRFCSPITLGLLLSTAALAQPAAGQTPQETNAEPKVIDRVESAVGKVTGSPAAKMDTDMKHVIDALASLHPKPIENLSAEEARKQPGAAMAAMQVLREAGRSSLPDQNIRTQNVLVDGGAGSISATVYTPEGAVGSLPIVVYYHGGGFVIANNSTYDASARVLSGDVNAIVVAVEYRKAPEHKFPAAHDDAIAAYKWVLKNAKTIGGDPARVALAGESAGANLVVNTAIAARDQNLKKPAYLLIIYPLAGTDTNTPSYRENASAKPLNKPMMEWFLKNASNGPQDILDARLDLVGKADLRDLPSVTVITAEIDPLRSEGKALAEKLKAARVTVNAQDYEGVTHDFFGMGLVVGKARAAESVATSDLKAAFARPAPK